MADAKRPTLDDVYLAQCGEDGEFDLTGTCVEVER